MLICCSTSHNTLSVISNETEIQFSQQVKPDEFISSATLLKRSFCLVSTFCESRFNRPSTKLLIRFVLFAAICFQFRNRNPQSCILVAIVSLELSQLPPFQTFFARFLALVRSCNKLTNLMVFWMAIHRDSFRDQLREQFSNLKLFKFTWRASSRLICLVFLFGFSDYTPKTQSSSGELPASEAFLPHRNCFGSAALST